MYREEDKILTLTNALETIEQERDELEVKFNKVNSELIKLKRGLASPGRKFARVFKDLFIGLIGAWLVIGTCYLEYSNHLGEGLVGATGVTLGLFYLASFITYMVIKYDDGKPTGF